MVDMDPDPPLIKCMYSNLGPSLINNLIGPEPNSISHVMESDCVHGGPGRRDPVPNLIKCMHLDLGSTTMDLIKTLIQHKNKK